MASLFSVRPRKTAEGCGAVIRARDVDAKQTLFGWGSDRRPSIEFYGRGLGPPQGDRQVWEWQLSAAGVAELQRNLATQLAQPEVYPQSAREMRLARTLKSRLDVVAKACVRPRK